jgi:spermidine synthase
MTAPARLAHPRVLAAVTLVVAFCSMVYELLLAQTLSATMGNTNFRYNLTIGLYLASLGLGAFLFGRRKSTDDTALLVDVELLLSIIGSTAPVAVLAVDAAAHAASDALGVPFTAPALQLAVHAANHGLIVIIGLLSGYELPLLMAIGAQSTHGTGHQVLITDYAGTLLAAIAFPLWLLPSLGVFGVAATAGLLNVLTALFIQAQRPGHRASPRTLLAAAAAIGLVAAITHIDAVTRFAVDTLYARPAP